MNKEVEEIVKSINTRKEYVGAPYMTLETKKIDLLLNYINQLETNIGEVIEILNQPILNYASCVKALDEIEEILGRGKD